MIDMIMQIVKMDGCIGINVNIVGGEMKRATEEAE